MAYYRNLLDYVRVLEREGLLFRVKRPINKDTEMHPLVRWQFRRLEEDQRRAFYFENIYDAKGNKYDIPVLIGGLAASQRIYALGLMCKEEEVEAIWSNALENPVDPILVNDGAAQEVVYEGEDLIRCGGLSTDQKYSRKQYPTLQGIQTVLDAIADENPKAKSVRPEQFVDVRFVKELDDSGYIDALYKGKKR